jgi:hypothetical protein
MNTGTVKWFNTQTAATTFSFISARSNAPEWAPSTKVRRCLTTSSQTVARASPLPKIFVLLS